MGHSVHVYLIFTSDLIENSTKIELIVEQLNWASTTNNAIILSETCLKLLHHRFPSNIRVLIQLMAKTLQVSSTAALRW